MHEERYGSRDRAYSAWHRRMSTRRFVGMELAQLLAMIDLDGALFVEYDDATKEPLALIETARDVGQRFKAATVTARLAQLAGLPCYVVLYRCSADMNPADSRWPDIDRFRVRRLWPRPESSWRTLAPTEWAKALLQIRTWVTWKIDRAASNDPQWEKAPEQGQLFA